MGLETEKLEIGKTDHLINHLDFQDFRFSSSPDSHGILPNERLDAGSRKPAGIRCRSQVADTAKVSRGTPTGQITIYYMALRQFIVPIEYHGRMNRLLHLLRTTIGRKLIVALTGIVLILFVVGHVSGNMTIYMGPSALNNYAHFLQTSSMLWVLRLVMLAIVMLHIALAIAVMRENRLARPVTCRAGQPWYLRIYQRRMMISGLVLLAFIAGHVSHLTMGAGVGEVFLLRDASGHVDVYSRVVTTFQNAWIAWAYIAAMLFLALHMKHTARAVFQTLGFYRENYSGFFEFLSWVVTLVVVGGFISIPLSIQLNWLVLP